MGFGVWGLGFGGSAVERCNYPVSLFPVKSGTGNDPPFQGCAGHEKVACLAD